MGDNSRVQFCILLCLQAIGVGYFESIHLLSYILKDEIRCSYVEDNAAALGGNARVNLTEDDKLDIDFSVFNIYKYNNANLTGHYEGPVTVIK